MEAALIYSLKREKDPSFGKELSFLVSSARVAGVSLTTLSFADAEKFIYAYFKEYKFIYFYDEDSYLLNLAMCLGVPCFSSPRCYAYHHDLALFYRRMQDYGIAHPRYCAFPNLKQEKPSGFFTYLSNQINEARISYPIVLRKKDDEGYAPFVCFSPVEFNEALKKIKDSSYVVEEYIQGAIVFALVIGKKCFGVLEEKKGKLTLASSDSHFLRAQAVKIAQLNKDEACLVAFKIDNGNPLAYGSYSARNFRLYGATFGSTPGEALFERLIKARKSFNPYFYCGSVETKKNRKAARSKALKSPHDNRY